MTTPQLAPVKRIRPRYRRQWKSETASGRGKNSIAVMIMAIAGAVVILRLGREFFIPVTLAFLLSFLVGKALRFLEDRSMSPRLAALVLSALLLCGSFLGTWLLVGQVSVVASQIPQYRANLFHKISSLEEKIQAVTEQFRWSVTGKSTSRVTRVPAAPAAAETATSALSSVQGYAPMFFHALALTAFVLVLTMFLAIHRDDLRDRLIRLAGERNIHITSEMLNEAAAKVSAYLSTQLLVNVLFGFSTAVIFFLCGIEFALLWGTILGLLRFIPFVGIVVGTALPSFFALATSEAWGETVIIVVTVLTIDFLVAQFVEPVVIGRRIGLSPVAVLISAFIWTMLWGPVGLILATPLTACLVVAGRYMPALEFATILFSDEAALTPSLQLYHRLLSRHDMTSDPWLDSRLKELGVERFLGEYFFPALSRLGRAVQRGTISRSRMREIMSGFTSTLDRCRDVSLAPAVDAPAPLGTIVAMPALDPIEIIVARALACLPAARSFRWKIISWPGYRPGVSKALSGITPDLLLVCSLFQNPAQVSRSVRAISMRARGTPVRVFQSYAESSSATKNSEQGISVNGFEALLVELAKNIGSEPETAGETRLES